MSARPVAEETRSTEKVIITESVNSINLIQKRLYRVVVSRRDIRGLFLEDSILETHYS